MIKGQKILINSEESKKEEIAPQEGPQSLFLSSKADIALYGGAAGSGKSYALLMEPLRHFFNSKFGCVIFRRTSVQIRNEGALWDDSTKLYSPLDAKPRQSSLSWEFSSGMRVKFAHLEYDKDVYSWQGSQIPLICFDELTHFTKKQFFYMLSRNRSASGVKGYIRCTCNPDASSWVRGFIDWWVGDDGLIIKERSGVLRYFVNDSDTIHWEDTPEKLIKKFGSTCEPKSFTFISANIYDNKILLEKDPGYLSNLKALSKIERARLLEGNWNILPTAGNYFQREWFPIVDTIPGNWIRVVRFWDRAATKPNETNSDPDWTRGLLLYQYSTNFFVVGDLRSMRDTPMNVERFIKNTASQDGYSVSIISQQDPGSAGVSEAEHFVKLLQGYDVRTIVISKDKETRARPVSAQCERGNILILRSLWNDEFFKELENFPEGVHDDIVDTLSGSFNYLSQGHSLLDVL